MAPRCCPGNNYSYHSWKIICLAQRNAPGGGTTFERLPYGQILTPSSSPSPVQNFAQNLAPQVPLYNTEGGGNWGTKYLTKTQDAPGYPTEVFDCTDPSATACNCPDGNKRDWEFIPLSEVGIRAGSLIGLEEEGDPRFPSAYIVQNGSTCIKKCNKYTGYRYVGPPGCTRLPLPQQQLR